MSHFSVLVIGLDYERQLAPYHEYECTGRDDEYVVDVDVTEEVVTYYDKPQKVVRLASGEFLSRCDEKLYTGAPKDKLDSKKFELPAGAEELELSAAEARTYGLGPLTMEEACESWCGGVIRDGRCLKHTNPGAKWDWYVLGGRWTGSFKLKPEARGLTGRAGLMTDPAAPGYADQALRGDVDLDQMRNDAEVKARYLWEETRKLTGGLTWETWDDTLVRYCGSEEKRDPSKIDLAREEYHGQPALELLKASGKDAYRWDTNDDLTLDLDKFIKLQRDRACAHFAFVRDGQWTERGDMGWFGMAANELSDGQWLPMFNKMLDELPDDTLLSVVDCHI